MEDLINCVKYIENGMFENRKDLTIVEILDSVTSIGGLAFSDCRGLTIYCEITSKPIGWSYDWNISCPVVWGYKDE